MSTPQQIVNETEPASPKRVEAFAHFFKRYMSISTVVVAALPVPATAFKLIPTFAAQTKQLSVFTSLFCFLLLGLIFYLRQQFARIIFYEVFERRVARAEREGKVTRFTKAALVGFIPFALIVTSITTTFVYNERLVNTVHSMTAYPKEVSAADPGKRDEVIKNIQESGQGKFMGSKFDAVLKEADLDDIPNGALLMLLYLLIFMSAEAAFIVMALREYLQDLLKLSDADVMAGGTSVRTQSAD